ncbi:MAG: tetratricopeptide repeat protein [Terrisporobacter sp.]
MEEIKILGEKIRIDIDNMPRKILDIDLIEDKTSDYTFFQIDEDENNDTLKALAQSYVTSNYKDETILNLQQELKESTNILPKEIKLESYNKYNNALELAQKSYITTAITLVDEALQLNPMDEDILNLRGLLKLLKCDFAKAFESFYTGQCYGNNELSRKYVDVLSSDEFKVFLERYNHSIRFINEELTEESMEIFDSLILEDPELIEPYVILILLYEKMGKIKEKEEFLERLRFVDADNHLFDKNHDHIDEEKFEVVAVKKEKKTIAKLKEHKKILIKKRNIAYVLIGIFILGAAAYTVYNKSRLEELNAKLDEKEQAINLKEDEINKKQDELSKTNTELDQAKEEKEEAQLLKQGEEALYMKAVKYKNAGDYENAIKYFKLALKDNSSKEFKGDSIYQTAISYEKLKDYDNALTYYKKYIYTYNNTSQFFDDAYYKMGMIYYNNDNLQKAKDTFYSLKYEDPNSSYAKSEKVNDILKK